MNKILFLPVYLEIVFHLLTYGTYTVQTFLIGLFSALAVGFALKIISTALKKYGNIIITEILGVLLSLYYTVEYVYNVIFGTYVSFYVVLGTAGDAFDFFEQAVVGIKASVLQIVLLGVVPILLLTLDNFLLSRGKRGSWKGYIYHVTALCLALWGMNISIDSGSRDVFSPYDLYHVEFVQQNGVEELGMIINLNKDIVETARNLGLLPQGESTVVIENISIPTATATPSPSPIVVQVTATPVVQIPDTTATPTVTMTPTPTPIDRSPYVLNIDFEGLAASESDKNIATLHQYFANEIPSNRNEYTGIFKDYNLIFITAEGWSPYAVSEELTPTLYKMIHTGFVFENFYNPIWYTSTSDGEFANISGLIPEGKQNAKRTKNNAMPYALGNIMKSNGYSTYAYHPHSYTYYNREASHPNFGYDIYRGYGGGVVNGEEKKEYGLPVKYEWPESDEQLMELSVPEYLEVWKKTGKPFHAYYMSVSGHMNYSWTDNAQSRKHKDYVAELPYSETSKAYIAANYELELAVNSIIRQLDEAGALENTLIVINADHYPYGLEDAAKANDEETGGNEYYYFNEMAGHEIDTTFELYKSNLIIWTASQTEDIVIEKACTSVDIMPTVLNLLGVDFDSRLLVGRDILSETPAFVTFFNRNFITDKIAYISSGNKVINLTEEEVPDGYVKACVTKVRNQFSVSKSIIAYDYFNYIKDFLTNNDNETVVDGENEE